MKRHLLIYALLILFFTGLDAQRRGLISSQRYDSGGYFIFSVGPAYCSADTYGLSDIGAFIFDESIVNGKNWCTSLGFKQIFPENFGYRVNLIYGNYTGADSKNRTPHSPFYSFSSDIMEITFRAEYTIKFGEKFRLQTPNSIYAFIGIGGLSTNVTNPAIPNYTVLKTEVPSTISGILPVGIGYQYDFRSGLTIGAEAGLQYAFSDELDGYNPPGNSRFNDMLAAFTITVGYKIF